MIFHNLKLCDVVVEDNFCLVLMLKKQQQKPLNVQHDPLGFLLFIQAHPKAVRLAFKYLVFEGRNIVLRWPEPLCTCASCWWAWFLMAISAII
jgi:hypothetical protein